MTPPTPDPPSPSKRLPAGRRHLRLLSLVAVAGLALSTALVALSGAFADPATQPMPDAPPAQQVARPESIQSSALAQLNSLPPLPDAAGGIGQATAASA
ncbi:MAG TPA: hypothetical protein VHI93_01320, partial [Candidatus Thermoplasmatota archaeon]|nr:hypothetical protein [Candidatus Thermoplasmatota archaeon]